MKDTYYSLNDYELLYLIGESSEEANEAIIKKYSLYLHKDAIML